MCNPKVGRFKSIHFGDVYRSCSHPNPGIPTRNTGQFDQRAPVWQTSFDKQSTIGIPGTSRPGCTRSSLGRFATPAVPIAPLKGLNPARPSTREKAITVYIDLGRDCRPCDPNGPKFGASSKAPATPTKQTVNVTRFQPGSPAGFADGEPGCFASNVQPAAIRMMLWSCASPLINVAD